MQESMAGSPMTAAKSYVGWWQLAGVDYLVDDAALDWLAPVEEVLSRPSEPRAVPKPQSPVAPPLTSTPRAKAPKASWPKSLAELQSALSHDGTLPGNGYGPRRAIPVGQHKPALMVIADYPEDSELEARQMGAIPLLHAMLRAIGIAPDACYFAALAHSRPTISSVPTDDLPQLGAFALHHIALVQPENLLLLGSSAALSLMQTDLMAARGVKRNINHDGGIVASLVTFHPRTLKAQRIFKAKAWQDLQILMQKDPV